MSNYRHTTGGFKMKTITKTTTVFLTIILWGWVASAETSVKEDCYKLVDNEVEKTSVVMCIAGENKYPEWNNQSVVFRDPSTWEALVHIPNFKLMSKGMCYDCNQDFFSLVYNAQENLPAKIEGFVYRAINPIKFEGYRSGELENEVGSVSLGYNKYQYSKVTNMVRELSSIK